MAARKGVTAHVFDKRTKKFQSIHTPHTHFAFHHINAYEDDKGMINMSVMFVFFFVYAQCDVVMLFRIAL
jgi:carotenoid cleavage dioxygenase-like enzyme